MKDRQKIGEYLRLNHRKREHRETKEMVKKAFRQLQDRAVEEKYLGGYVL